jgi:hypothetical protein
MKKREEREREERKREKKEREEEMEEEAMENSCARCHISAWSCGPKKLLERKRGIPAGTKQKSKMREGREGEGR